MHHYYLDAEHLELVTTPSNEVLARYMRGVVVDEVVNGYQRANTNQPLENFTWLHDATQSVTQTLEHTGATEWQERYLPFGEAMLGASTSNSLRYAGREQDESGLYYYRARYYDPSLGRFLSEDPLGFEGGINLYAYVENNPLIATDPFGWLTLVLHGTWANGEAWPKPGSDFNAAVSATFGEQAQAQPWPGGNTVGDRTSGAQSLLFELERRRGLDPGNPDYWAPGEPLNIVAHSHGGNVVKEFTNLPGAPRIDTLVILGTPQRPDYDINRENVGRYISAYSTTDQVQVNGGPIWLGGAAGRMDPLAANINLGSFGILNPIDSHGMTHDADVWRNQIDPVITRYPSSGSSSSTRPYCIKGWCW